MLKLNTHVLFYELLRALEPATIFDIGSLDAKHALRFKKILPRARVISFEANPANVAAIMQSADFLASGIELVAKAVSDRDGVLSFYVEETAAEEVWRKGISSTRERKSGSLGTTPTQIDATRLDSYVAQRSDVRPPLALWIDVEGASYEVLRGIEDVKDVTSIIHVEVETREFWAGQHLKGDVEALMNDWGFSCVARGRPEGQHDLVFIRRDILEAKAKLVNRVIRRAWLITSLQRCIGDRNFISIGTAYLDFLNRRSRKPRA